MYAAMSSKDCCFGLTSSKSIGDTWPFCPKKFLLVGSMKLTLTIRAAFGKENPRSMIPFTTLNIVVTPQMPRARTMTDNAQKPFSRRRDRKSTRLNSSHGYISYAVFCLKKKKYRFHDAVRN